MARENPLWSRRRIAAELARLGHGVDKDTVAKYMPAPSRRPGPRSQTWKISCATTSPGPSRSTSSPCRRSSSGTSTSSSSFRSIRRRILHVNVTSNPSAAWAAQQIVEAVGTDLAPRFLIRDRDGIFGRAFDSRVENLGIEQLKTAPRSPWQNGYAERWVGTLRRELLDHVIVLGERHLLRLVREYVAYYNADRPHMALGGMRPSRGLSSRPPWGASSLFLGSADCIIATRGSLERAPTGFSSLQVSGGAAAPHWLLARGKAAGCLMVVSHGAGCRAKRRSVAQHVVAAWQEASTTCAELLRESISSTSRHRSCPPGARGVRVSTTSVDHPRVLRRNRFRRRRVLHQMPSITPALSAASALMPQVNPPRVARTKPAGQHPITPRIAGRR